MSSSSTGQDPLNILRAAIQSSSEVSFLQNDEPCSTLATATHISFPGALAFEKSAPTRYKKSSSGDSDSPDVYTLECIYLAWLFRELPSAEYMKQMRENGIGAGWVSVTERRGVVSWLEGAENDENVIPLGTVGTRAAAKTETANDSHTPPGSPVHRPQSSATPKFSNSSSLPVASSSPTKRRYVPDHTDMEVVKKIKLQEVELKDRVSVLRGKGGNFAAIRDDYSARLKKLKEAGKPGAPEPKSSVPSTPSSISSSTRKARNSYPIIMISSSPTALITMWNVKKFLEEASFEPTQTARTNASARPEDMIPIYRKVTSIDSGGKESSVHAKYFIVDSTEALSKFGADAWERVVCVMTTGQLWQFKPYKWSEPRVLFHHVKGIHISWTTDPPNPKIKDWNVTELRIDPHRRHVDKSVVAGFWKTLDTWVLSNKPWLGRN